MKLSKMTSNKAADVYLTIAPDIQALIEDEGLAEVLASRKVPEDGEDTGKLGKIAMLKTVSYLLKNNRENVWNILAALNDKQPEEIAEQNILLLTTQIIEVLSDKDLIAFFMSFAKLAQQQL